MSWETEKESLGQEILTLLYENRMIRTFYRDRPEGWTLVSGLYSPLYIQLRPLASFPHVFEKVCHALGRMIHEEAGDITRVIGIAMAGVPLAAGMAITSGIPAGFTRKIENVKSAAAFRDAIARYGEHNMLEGELSSGDHIALVDDLVTRFDSKLVALEQVRYELSKRGISDAECRKIVVVLDREQGGQQAAQTANVELLSLIPFKSIGLPLLKGVMNPTEWATLIRYLDNPEEFQDPTVQQELTRLASSTS
jgi:uridine monophosphate synthetase